MAVAGSSSCEVPQGITGGRTNRESPRGQSTKCEIRGGGTITKGVKRREESWNGNSEPEMLRLK